jgi:hypothetical protein
MWVQDCCEREGRERRLATRAGLLGRCLGLAQLGWFPFFLFLFYFPDLFFGLFLIFLFSFGSTFIL